MGHSSLTSHCSLAGVCSGTHTWGCASSRVLQWPVVSSREHGACQRLLSPQIPTPQHQEDRDSVSKSNSGVSRGRASPDRRGLCRNTPTSSKHLVSAICKADLRPSAHQWGLFEQGPPPLQRDAVAKCWRGRELRGAEGAADSGVSGRGRSVPGGTSTVPKRRWPSVVMPCLAQWGHEEPLLAPAEGPS